jgi:hypothetical protein
LKLASDEERASVQFTLARALAAAKRERSRSRALAAEAQAHWQRQGDHTNLDKVSQWLAEHGGP